MKFRTAIAALALLAAVSFVASMLVLSVFRDRLFDLYTHRLDDWVSSDGKVATIQSAVVENCGKLVLTQAGVFERLQLLTFDRDEFDFRVDICTKMTVNRLYKQPEFDKPEMVSKICDNENAYYELFRRLCSRSGLRPGDR
jgi:hypothetical protein